MGSLIKKVRARGPLSKGFGSAAYTGRAPTAPTSSPTTTPSRPAGTRMSKSLGGIQTPLSR